MSETRAQPSEEAEIEMLLPWYVTGKLDHADRARVEAYLASHPEMARRLALMDEEWQETVAANEAIAAPSAASLDRLLADVRREGRTNAPLLGYLQTGWDQVKGFFQAPSPGAVRWAAAAAAAVLLVQAAMIGSLLVERSGGGYQIAAGPQSTAGFTALVSFADNATAAQISGLLSEFQAQILDGPKPGGVYKIRFGAAPEDEAAQNALLRRLAERRDVVRTVLRSKE